MKFGALWIGSQLNKTQELCLKSFLYYGHEVTLFVYDDNISVPEGVIKKDAREVLSEESVFMHMGSYAGFSDMFRVYMVKKTELIWTDVDMICLSSSWNFENNFIFGKGHDGDDHINPGIFYIPSEHPAINDMIYSIENNKFDSNNWITYMLVITDSLKKNNIFNSFQPAYCFSPIDWTEIDVLFKKEKTQEVLSRIKNSKSMAVYNSQLNKINIDQNIFPEGSTIDYFNIKFNRKKSINE